VYPESVVWNSIFSPWGVGGGLNNSLKPLS
jgi:hypothetical protein